VIREEGGRYLELKSEEGGRQPRKPKGETLHATMVKRKKLKKETYEIVGDVYRAEGKCSGTQRFRVPWKHK